MKTKENMIEEYLREPIKPGERVLVRGLGSQNKTTYFGDTEVHSLAEDDGIYIIEYRKKTLIKKEDWRKSTYHIGYDPFPKQKDLILSLNFTLKSVLFELDIIKKGREKYKEGDVTIEECNWNPYVFINGEKRYYQRDFVWTEDDKKNLIDSIYNNIDCGKILIRKRSFKEIATQVKKGETEVAFNDIVDGKQRLKAMKDFMENKFTDSNGYFYKDLSNAAQQRLVNHQLFSYSEFN